MNLFHRNVKRGLALSVLGTMYCATAWASDKPNFIFVIADDQTYRSIHELNNSEVKTPNLDRLVKKGVTFTHTFNMGAWSGAICMCSRTMLNTGQTVYHAQRNKKYLPWIEHDHAKYETEVPTWAESFAKKGYNTMLVGKWHNTDYCALRGFKEGRAVGLGFYETSDKKNGYERVSQEKWAPYDKSKGGHWDPTVKDIVYNEKGEAVMGAPYTAHQHTSELYAQDAINYLSTEAKQSNAPFFLYVAFNAPHDPRQSPKEYVDMYPTDQIQIPENYLPEHPFDQGDSRIRDEMLAPFPRTKEAVKMHRQEYYAIISHMDHELGRIVEALEKSGKAENTYIVFTADHGLAVGQHGLMGKQNQYDHSIRVPMIISGPNLPHNKQIDNKVYIQDINPTLCELAGLEIPKTVEFHSMVPLLKGDVKEGDYNGEEYVYGTYLGLQRMVRSDQYKLIVYPVSKHIQLFDMKNDPMEMHDLASNKKYKSVKKKLYTKLKSLQNQYGDYLTLDDELIK